MFPKLIAGKNLKKKEKKMQTEKDWRTKEELVTVDDYLSQIQGLIEFAGAFQGDAEQYLVDTINVLCKGIYYKYKYIDKISRKWRKKQGFFSKMNDYFVLKAENHRLKQELKEAELLDKLKKAHELVDQVKKVTPETPDIKQDVTTSTSTLIASNPVAVEHEPKASVQYEQQTLLEF